MYGRPFFDGRFPFTEFDSFVNNSVTLTPLQYQKHFSRQKCFVYFAAKTKIGAAHCCKLRVLR